MHFIVYHNGTICNNYHLRHKYHLCYNGLKSTNGSEGTVRIMISNEYEKVLRVRAAQTGARSVTDYVLKLVLSDLSTPMAATTTDTATTPTEVSTITTTMTPQGKYEKKRGRRAVEDQVAKDEPTFEQIVQNFGEVVENSSFEPDEVERKASIDVQANEPRALTPAELLRRRKAEAAEKYRRG